MATSTASAGPRSALAQPGGAALPPTPARVQASFDAAVWYALSLWPALHVAWQNGWGGAASADKRDWFAGAVSTLFDERPDTDQQDLEEFLLQVMNDEFDCNVEDDSEVEVARTVLALRQQCANGDLAGCHEVERRWRSRGLMKVDVHVVDDQAEVDDDEFEAWAGFDEDVEMDEAPALVAVPARRERVELEVDDDGFTKVVGKKRR